jgi:O-antigen/teichoic acid export membrane protein
MRRITEKSGLFLSLACTVHCFATPLLLSVLPFTAHLEWLHEAELWIVLLSAFLAFSILQKDYKRLHQKVQPIAIAALGFSLMIGGTLTHLHFLSAVGGVVVAVAYYFNWRFRKSCSCASVACKK